MDNYGVDNDLRGRDRNHYGSHNSVNDIDVGGGHREHSATNVRPRKPEQQLYVPRSADPGSDNERQAKTSMRSDNSSQYVNRRMSNKQDKQGFNTGTGSYTRGASRREYSYKDGANNDINYNNRNYRQTSETRSISPTHCPQEQNTVHDRNRDSRSMETSAGRHMSGSGGKPPSGRRNSAGYPEAGRPKYMVNLDNIPPRFRKKFLEQSGHHSFDNVDQISRDRPFPNHALQPNYNHNNQFYNSNTNWSQTLPSRGRGRLRDNESFDREKFISTYLKSYEAQNSRRSTPSNSYMNLYEPNAIDNKSVHNKPDAYINNDSPKESDASKNGMSTASNDSTYNQKENQKHDTDNEQDSETISQISSNIIDMTLDWTEEVEKTIKLDDMCESSTSFCQSMKSSVPQDVKPVEARESKRSGRSRRRDKRSSSRGQRNSEKKSEKNRKDSNVSNISISESEYNRKDSNVSLQHEAISASLRQRERERRDSHRSNRSSTIGNSRDDLDRWRSLRSYSREQSTEGRIVSQCNSRDTSANRDSEGFRVPSAVSKSGTWSNSQKKNNGSWSGRTPSMERGRHSPAPSIVSTGGDVAEAGGAAPEAREGRSKRSRRSRPRRKHADTAPPTPHPPGATPAPTNMNWREEILESKKHTHDKHQENTHQRNRLNSAMSEKSVTESSTSQPGILILPQSSVSHLQKDQGRGGSVETQKTLFDHHNPSKPIIVQTSPSKVDMRMERSIKESSSRGGTGYEVGDAARAARHRALLQEVDRADAVLQTHTLRGPLALAEHWNDVIDTRKSLQNALQRLLMSDLKYCQADNIEHHFWKILYYNFIEILRKSFTQVSPEDKPKIVKLINVIIEEGNTFFESLVQMLERTYKFNTDDYINDNHALPPKGLGYVGLALISVQKLYVFLGDLARYKEQVNETSNYAKSKFWYTKAQQINPKNGRPYNQLAILAIYARRKLDAVYYYMRSLMSSNPFHSARESLLSLFDENRKKYEAAERKRRATLETTNNTNGEAGSSGAPGQSLRREVWVRPSGHRTTTLRHDTRDEHLASMTPVELNKTFITSYLHVHGKLITKIGMETFHESAGQMLRQFRALLHRQPLPTPAARLLQLTALNMFAVETTAASLKDGSSGGERSAWLQCALGVSLLMFGAMLERCCALLPEPAHTQQHADALLLLPAIKAWSDWMLCHSSVWNPPPSFDNFQIESETDPWDWLAKLMNILEECDDKTIQFENEMKEGYVVVRLPEDASLAGFTPLMYMEPAAAWARADASLPPHAAEHTLRTRKLLFFGTEYLVGVEPPVLRLEYPAGAPPRYVSAVQTAPQHLPVLHHLSEDSEDETASGPASGPTSLGECSDAADADEATRKLLRRKEQLESRKATLERRRQRMNEILRGGWVSVEVEVRPRWLVPDTNCFIDHLQLLRAVAGAALQPYLLAVPLVVMTELEGLKRCARVGERARAALSWVSGGGGGGGGAVRLATSRGSLLASRAFTAEQDTERGTNDDKVLSTALNLHANLAVEPDTRGDDGADSKCVRRVREVVLLTDDRNLRVKALAAELPARDLPSFVQWAGLDATNTQAPGIDDSTSGQK
ncbi:telomerase-binding protein EST1A isoform X2 [Pectinophora gossypiella]|nr:telomerase-binding protein EST1A isoform X2 [Pectinophora gossypiella]XP_049867627.1 telomerase-binding protein EST1A isoform X2 [Pectinophora gossypiella]